MVEVMGHKLVTHHPVIEPVSATEPGTEICDAETGALKPAYHLPEIDPETRKECETRNRREWPETEIRALAIVLLFNTAIQAAAQS